MDDIAALRRHFAPTRVFSDSCDKSSTDRDHLLPRRPVVLIGAAVAQSGRFPAWFGWDAIVAGAASVVLGVAMFGGLDLYPAYVPFAVILSIWMVVVGVAMWRWSNDPHVSTVV